MKLIFTIVFVLLVSNSVTGQGVSDEIKVQSWRQGSARIVEESVRVRVSAKNQEFSQTIRTTAGGKLLLRLIYIPPVVSKDFETGSSTESWRVELRPFDEKKRKRLGGNLLRAEGPGKGGDYFPREDLIGYLYPKTTSGSKINGVPFIDGRLYYPILIPRKICVDKFSVLIKVLGYQLNTQNPHLVDFMDIVIDFKNL